MYGLKKMLQKYYNHCRSWTAIFVVGVATDSLLH